MAVEPSPPPLSGDDAVWMRAMIRGLQARDVRPEWIGEAVAYVEAVCARTHSTPQAQFGDAAAFARRVEFPLRPMQASAGHEIARMMGATRVSYTGILLVLVGVLGALAAGAAATAFAAHDPKVTVSLGVGVVVVGVLALVLGATRVPPATLFRHPAGFIIGGFLTMVALVLAGVFVPWPSVKVPLPVFIGIAAGLCAASLVGFLVTAVRARRGNERQLAEQLTVTGAGLLVVQLLLAWFLAIGD